MIKLLLTFFLSLLIIGCTIPEPKPKKLNISFQPSENDRIIFYIDDTISKEFKLSKYPSNFKFNDCKPHLIDKYKETQATKQSLENCKSDFNVSKIEDKYYLSGAINIYKSQSLFTFGNTKSQTFNKATIGIRTNFDDYVYGLSSNGKELQEGVNKDSIIYEEVKVIFLFANKPYSL